MPESLRSAIEESARRSARSINSEIVQRLESSFSREVAFGGPRTARYVYLMASSFALSGQRSAGTTDESWLDTEGAFLSAVTGVFDALMRDRSLEDAALVLQALIGRHATREVWEKSK
jgi:hypothetical protein